MHGPADVDVRAPSMTDFIFKLLPERVGSRQDAQMRKIKTKTLLTPRFWRAGDAYIIISAP